MGTNYYVRVDALDGQNPYAGYVLHVGKSSYGWAFSLHVIPERGLNDLGDWLEFLRQPNRQIYDEYSVKVSIDTLTEVITCRGNGRYCLPGQQVLRMTDYGPRYVRGPGTWDLCPGEFS